MSHDYSSNGHDYTVNIALPPLNILARIIPAEPREPESGYSLGYPGAPEEIEIHEAWLGEAEISTTINALEEATGAEIWEAIQAAVNASERMKRN